MFPILTQRITHYHTLLSYNIVYHIQRVELEGSQATVTELESHMKHLTDEKRVLSSELLTITKELGELKIKTNRVGFATLLFLLCCESFCGLSVSQFVSFPASFHSNLASHFSQC